MTVHDNVAFGLKVRKRPKAEIRARVQELLELVRLDGLAERYPSQLSGGQLQRMALARALAVAAAGAAAGRAVRRARRAGPRRAARVAAPAARGDPRDDDLRHARPGGGDGGRRADRGHERRAGSSRRARRTSCTRARANEFVMSFIGPVNRLGDVVPAPPRHPDPPVRRRRHAPRRSCDASSTSGFEVRVELTLHDGRDDLGPGHPRDRRAARASRRARSSPCACRHRACSPPERRSLSASARLPPAL